MDDHAIHSLIKVIPQMSRDQRDESEAVLEDLQKAVEEHEKILRRQAELIARLRAELKGVQK
jgi:bacterioferritin (cytochrome b1)